MKGRSVTLTEKRFHDALCKLGCIACRQMGRPMDADSRKPVSIHHMDGRTKPQAHWLVLPLCAGHHQDGYGEPGEIAIHPWKAEFEAAYGTEEALLQRCIELLKQQDYPYQTAYVDRVKAVKRSKKIVAHRGFS